MKWFESRICEYSSFSQRFHRTDSEDWKEFISKPSLPYILRLLTGLSGGHTGIQQQIGKDIIPVLHKLEQVSSDEHIGTMAENLMEALKENQQVKARVSVSLDPDCLCSVPMLKHFIGDSICVILHNETNFTD